MRRGAICSRQLARRPPKGAHSQPTLWERAELRVRDAHLQRCLPSPLLALLMAMRLCPSVSARPGRCWGPRASSLSFSVPQGALETSSQVVFSPGGDARRAEPQADCPPRATTQTPSQSEPHAGTCKLRLLLTGGARESRGETPGQGRAQGGSGSGYLAWAACSSGRRKAGGPSAQAGSSCCSGVRRG